MSESNLLNLSFSDILESVKLRNLLLLHSVNIKVQGINHNLLFKIFQHFLFIQLLLLDHVVSTYENCFEVIFGGESCLSSFDFTLEVGFAVGSWNIRKAFELLLGLSYLDVIWRLSQVLQLALMWLLGMQIPVFSFHHIIETSFGFPSSFIELLFFLYDFIFIYNWESKTQMLS